MTENTASFPMDHPTVDFSFFDTDGDGLPAILQRIPDTTVTQFFTGFYMLDIERRQEVSRTAIEHAKAALMHLIDPASPRPPVSPVIREVLSLGASHSSERCMSLKLLKQWTGAMKSEKPGARRMSGPVNSSLIAYVDKFETIPAAEMRKQLKAHLAEQYQLKAQNWSSGVWRYLNPARGAGLEIDFGGSYGQQLRYRILHPHSRVGTCLEMLWGIGIGDWNFIHRGNWDTTLAALGEIYEFFDRVLPVVRVPPENDGPRP